MTRTNCPGSPGTVMVFLTLLICSVLITIPASAVTQHLGNGPAFAATVSGVNEFAPGEDTTISILIKNTGLDSMKQVMMGTIQPEDQQNTAKTVNVGLGSAGDAVLIRTDPQMVGDIQGGDSITVQFKAKISANATAGEYQLPLTIRYRYLKVIVQERADVFEYTYNEAEDTVPMTIRIQPHVKADVIEAVPDQIIAGSEGYLNLTIRNSGPENGTMASVKLLRNGKSPIIPVDSTVFIGNFKSGGMVTCRYRISVSKDATNQTYPVDVAVSYMDREGTVVTSAKTTIGVSVNDPPVFTILSSAPDLPRGSESTIEVRYRNDGTVTVHDAQARITPHSPVTSGDNNAYLGDIAPGETATARYVLTPDAEAAPGEYSLDSTVRYRDEKGTSLESDPIPVRLNIVKAAGGISAVTAAGVLVLIAACIAFLMYRQKNKSR
jgi:uncharacterized membrane protein